MNVTSRISSKHLSSFKFCLSRYVKGSHLVSLQSYFSYCIYWFNSVLNSLFKKNTKWVDTYWICRLKKKSFPKLKQVNNGGLSRTYTFDPKNLCHLKSTQRVVLKPRGAVHRGWQITSKGVKTQIFEKWKRVWCSGKAVYLPF